MNEGKEGLHILFLHRIRFEEFARLPNQISGQAELRICLASNPAGPIH